MLAKDGHEVDVALDGRDGVKRAASRVYDLVLMDISMPVMDRIEATREIRANEPAGTHLPIVALTTNAIPSERDRFLAAGLDDILVKPVSLKALRAILARNPNAPHRAPGVHDAADADDLGVRVDHGHLEELASARGPDKIDNLIGAFMAEMDAGIATIAERLRKSALDDGLRVKVHHAAGSSALLGAERLRETLVALETRLAEGRPCGPRDGNALDRIWTGTAAEVRLHLA